MAPEFQHKPDTLPATLSAMPASGSSPAAPWPGLAGAVGVGESLGSGWSGGHPLAQAPANPLGSAVDSITGMSLGDTVSWSGFGMDVGQTVASAAGNTLVSGAAETMGKGLGVASGLVTAVTHESASQTGVGQVAESVAVGAVDTLWNLAGGPVAMLDQITGGHVGNGLKGGASAAFAGIESLITGDSRGAAKATDSLLEGKFGGIAQAGAMAGDAIGDGISDMVGHSTLEHDPSVKLGPRERKLEKELRAQPGFGKTSRMGWTDESRSNRRLKRQAMRKGGYATLDRVEAAKEAKASKAGLAENARADAQAAGIAAHYEPQADSGFPDLLTETPEDKQKRLATRKRDEAAVKKQRALKAENDYRQARAQGAWK